jgi:hypothetical protein
MKEIIEWIRKSDRREAENIATELENEALIVIAASPEPEGEEDLANPGQRLPTDAVELAIHQQEIQLIAKRRSSLREGRPSVGICHFGRTMFPIHLGENPI